MSKSVVRRQRDPNFISRYFVGDGIDIGGYPDPLSLYTELFPLINKVKIWDLDDGDAQFMEGVLTESVDFVTSSHCLEHLRNPIEGLINWFRILKPGGYLVLTFPDEDLYEQGEWPSKRNQDHKWTFTINKKISWSEKSIRIFDLLDNLGEASEVKKIELLDSGFRYKLTKFDQTLTPTSESAIEVVIRKKNNLELDSKMNFIPLNQQPEKELVKYFNQYKNDYLNLKNYSKEKTPFQDYRNLNEE